MFFCMMENVNSLSYEQKAHVLNDLDRRIMVGTEKLLLKKKFLNLKAQDLKARLQMLENRKSDLTRDINVIFPLMRKKMQDMELHHKEKIGLQRKKTNSITNVLSQRLEHQIRYRLYNWEIDTPAIYDQIEAFFDLLAYTHQNMPVKDVNPWLQIDKSISFLYKRVQRIKIQLKALDLEYTTALDNMTYKMNEINKRRDFLKRKDQTMHEKYQDYLYQFAKEDDDMIEAIENQFRTLLQQRNERFRMAQFRAADRYVEAKKSGDQLQGARDKYLFEKFPLKAMQKKMHFIYESNSISAAKLRVDKIIYNHLLLENTELKEKIHSLEDIVNSSSSSTTSPDSSITYSSKPLIKVDTTNSS